MSHTNHRRGFVATRFTLGQRTSRVHTFDRTEKSLDGSGSHAISTIFSENATQIRRDKAGAKKFVHSRRRRKDRDFLNRLDRSQHE